MIFERVADYICDHNRGKATEDERKQFEKELLNGSIIRDFDLLRETLITLLADETAEAEELADELAGAYNTEFRICDICGEIMFDRYVYDGYKYYCSKKCLYTDFDEDGWYDEEYASNEESYYTQWY